MHSYYINQPTERMKSPPMIYLTSIIIAITICKDALAFSPPKSKLSVSVPQSTLLYTTNCKSPTTTQLQSSTSNEEEQITIDQYSRCLYTPSEEKQSIKKETSQYSIIDPRPKWQSNLLKPIKFTGRSLSKIGNSVTKVGSSIKRIVVSKSRGSRSSKKQPGQLILLRCGESEWTKNGRFTGWADVDLIEEGVLEIEHAAR